MVEIIDKGRAAGESIKTICAVLEVTPRAYYRWKKGAFTERHGGGGGWNELTPAKEKKIVAYAKKQGFDLWLSGIGRSTGNARNERVIGTLKEEEIKLQDRYQDDDQPHRRIGCAIWDYNDHRPNTGVGGFAPNFVHHMGRKAAMERRQRSRGLAATLRHQHWKETRPSQGATYLENQADS